MYAQISTLAFVGIEARAVEVQVRITPGAPAFAIVGLPDKAVAESRERVRNALHAVGLGLPYKHLTINLAPADLPKEGSHFDLPIALALMAAMGAIAPDAIADFAAIGELALDGSIRDVPGGLPAAIGANALGKGLICPAGCGAEAAWAGEDFTLLAPPHLLSLVNHFKGLQTLSRPKPNVEANNELLPDLRDIKGQESAKRALEIAAAGGHNLLMVGPPGSGKSMLAARLPSILPPLEVEEMLEVSMVHSLAGELMGGKLASRRPFRAPHHSASMAALVGGGSRPKPGEVSLAHLGVLFLDELPEFTPQVLDSLRQPIETGETVIARANHRVVYPSRFQLVAAMNPCRCGGGSPGQSCKRGPRCASDYQARVSGPLMDRIDLQIEVPAVSAADLVLPPPVEGSADVRIRVDAARQRQRERFRAHGATRIRTNAECSGELLEKTAMPDGEGRALLRQAADTLGLSARGFHRTLKVARTLADLDGVEEVGQIHIAEALSYRGESLRQRQVA
ncbi:magnesium chelatase family protein [Filomicrobium insigne]|nr:YifB family Mg chelatase-like AAA ATPase [Filomicrobium insigne]SDP57310.1 magnesium chelatase family protein [Filomicrobium insigne]